VTAAYLACQHRTEKREKRRSLDHFQASYVEFDDCHTQEAIYGADIQAPIIDLQAMLQCH
jgi:hypothetical protein